MDNAGGMRYINKKICMWGAEILCGCGQLFIGQATHCLS